jgi:2-polyprenyl-3-methyl-5-hydroxy-6-metoxy-1,4-benzoquinol methylase
MDVIALSCPICKSKNTVFITSVKDVEYFSSKISYNYFNCNKCECIFLNKPPVKKLNQIYPKNYYSFDLKHNNYFHKFLEYVKSKFDKIILIKCLKNVNSQKILSLDVGGGAGAISNILKKIDTRVTETTILDIDSKAQAIAIKNGHKYIKSNIEKININNKFNFVLMLNLIEHVSNPRKVLKITHRLMKKSGVLLIKTPNTLSFNRKLFSKIYWGGYHAPRHWVLFNKKSFSSLALELGFDIKYFSYTQGAPQWSASIIGSIISIFAITPKIPMHQRFSFRMLLFFFAIFDYITFFLLKTDQMFFLLKKK